MSKRTPPKMTSGGDNPYNIHDAKLSRSATTHESSSVTAHEISNNLCSLKPINVGTCTAFSFFINGLR